MPNRLPIVVSLPHAGLAVPPQVADLNRLSAAEIAADGDAGAAAIYGPLEGEVRYFVTTEIARAFVDQNRAEDDRGPDGVVKTHTCWGVPIYGAPLGPERVEALLACWYRPYQARLRELSGGARGGAVRPVLGVDCHTMAGQGPPVAPDAGRRRPLVCIGDGEGACPRGWAEALVQGFARRIAGEVSLNRPFSGGHIARFHGREMPWVQIEISRAPFATDAEKAELVLAVLRDWIGEIGLW